MDNVKVILVVVISVVFVVAIVAGISYYIGNHNCKDHKLTLDISGMPAGKPIPQAMHMAGGGASGGARGGAKEIVSPDEAKEMASGKGKFSKKIVLMIYSPGCGHCTTTKPALNAAANGCSVPFYTIDITKHRDVLNKFKVTGVPHVILVEGGAEMAKYSGDRSPASFKAFAERQVMPSQAFQ